MKRGVQTLAFATPLALATLGGALILGGCDEGETGGIQASGTVCGASQRASPRTRWPCRFRDHASLGALTRSVPWI